jgi:tetratricopeptide (TPR) repeat protein
MGNENMSAGQLLKQANRLKRGGKLDEAIHLYHQILEIDPSLAWAYSNLADSLVEQGDLDAAVVEYRRAIEIDPNSAWFYMNLGQIFLQKNCWEEATNCFRQAIQLKPKLLDRLNEKYELPTSNLPMPTLAEARSFWCSGDWEALVGLDRADLIHHPERGKLALLAAAGYQQLGDMNATKRCTHLALEWGCSYNLVYRILASGIYNMLGKGAAAAHQYQQSFKYFSDTLKIAKVADCSQEDLFQSRVKKQIEQLHCLDSQRVINFVLNSEHQEE